jgi:hypothetical protein
MGSIMRKALLALGPVIIAAAWSPIREVGPTEWPLERMVANLEARLTEAPDDIQARYNLGRAHAFAFALERSTLWAFPRDDVRYVKDWRDQEKRGSQLSLPPLTPEQRLVHLTEGVRQLSRVCSMAGDSGYRKGEPHLTFAWLLETGATFAGQVDTPGLLGAQATPLSEPDEAQLRGWIAELGASAAATAEAARQGLSAPENLTRALPLLYEQRASTDERRRMAVLALLERAWIERAIVEYAHALELSFPVEASGESLPSRDEEERRHMVSYEAIEGSRRLITKRGVQGPVEERLLADLATKQQQLDELPLASWITPMIVAVEHCKALDELLAPGVLVPFDLDGDGLVEPWPWVAPSTGFLVWDPEHRGEITSGLQLFGSASGWLFFPDGYHVLDALDDDRDQRLTGSELAGIAVWFDRDTDGVSDEGEVLAVEDLGIVALATDATERIGPSLGNPCGLELADGTVLPTYDWVLERVAP